MKKQTAAAALRQKAEAMLKTRTDVTNNISTDADILKLIHEIEVHQIELELQNEELQQAKQQAELAAEKYSDLYDFAPLGYFSLSEEGKIIELNLAGARMLGKERSRLQNISFGHFVSHESKPAFNRFLAEASSGTANVTCEVALAANSGNPMFVNLTGARDESGERYLLTAVDISKHKKEEALLRIKEYDLKESQRIAHVGSWRLDLKTNEVLWTEELYNMYGFDSSVPPPPYTEHMKLFTPESWERLSTALAHTRKTGIPYTLELETIRKDGTNGWMWVRGETEVDDTGKTVALWGAAQDITERKIAENEILWRNDDLQLMNSITVAANNNNDLGSIIELISAQLRKTFSSHLISIFLPDVENRELRMYGNKLDSELINKIEKLTGRTIPQIRLKMDGENPFTEVERSLTGLLFVGKKAITNRLAGYLIGTPWPVMVQNFVKKLLPLLCDIIDYQSSVAVPLISNGIIAGYLELGSRKILTNNDLNRIQAIANQLASVIARNESNKKLRKSEQIMSSAFNFAAIGMAFVSPEGRWLKVNAAVLAMLGYTEAELMSKTFQEITHPDDLGKDLNYVRQMLEGTIQTYQMEKRYFHKSGSIIWILLSVSLVNDEQGHPLHFISQIQDITERKLAESKLKESEEKYRSIFESVQEVYFEASMDGTLHEVSPSIEVITKGLFKRDEMIGQSFAGIYENSRERDVYFSRLFEQKRVNDYELRLKNKDDSIIHCAISSALSFDASGNPVKITGILRDITERKNAENALKETLEQLNQAKLYLEERVEERTKEILEISGLQKAILENAPIAIMTINEQGVYQSINPAGEKMLGYSAGEVIGKLNPFSFHDKDEMLRICFEMTAKSNPTDEELFHAVLQYMFHKTTEWTWIRKNGEKFPVRIIHSSIVDDLGNLQGFMGIIMDITEEKLAIETLRESEERFQSMFYDHAAIMLLVNPESGEIIEANKAAQQFYGLLFYREPKLLISDINILSLDEMKEKMKIALSQHQNCFIFKHKIASGEIRTVEVHSTPISIRGEQVLFSIIHDITERKLAEDALNKSEAENRAIIRAVPDLMFRISRDGTYLDCLTNNQNMLFVPREQFIGKTISQVLPPDLALQSMAAIEMASQNEDVATYEYSLTVNGKERYFENRIIGISNNEVLSIIRDISERKELEAALKMQIVAFESFSLAIIITDIKGRIQWVNSAFTQLTGYSVDEAIGKMTGELVKSGKQDQDFYTTFWDTILSKNVWSGELINSRKDGSIYYEEETITPVLDSQGNISSFIAIKIDITERKKLYQELTEERRRLAGIIKGTNIATWEWNVQTGETVFNEQWAEILGYTLDEISPVSIETWIKFAHPDDLIQSNELLEKHFTGKLDYYSFESRMKHKNGDWVWVLDRGKVHEWDDEGKPLLMSGTHQDITERKRATEFETELLQLSLQLTGIPGNEIPAALNMALQKIGTFLSSDRAYIFEINEAEKTMTNTFEWCNEGINPEIENLKDIPCDIFPNWMAKLGDRENIIITSVKDLPDEWIAEREVLEPQGIQSLIVIPMFIGNMLTGFVGLDSVRSKREYKLSEINNLKVWGNMLAGLINHRHNDEIVEQTRRNYENFFNTIDDFLFVLDMQGNIMHTNSTVVKRLGYHAKELVEKSVLMVHPPERRDEAGRIVGEMLAGTAEFCPVPLVTKSGDYIPVETKVKFGSWNGQDVIFGVSKDISKIRLSEEKFSKAFQSNSALMAISSADGTFIDVNDTFLNTLGYLRSEVVGNNTAQLKLFDNIELRDTITDKLKNNIPVRELELEVRAKSGEIRFGLFSADQIYIGKDACLLTMMVDITDRKNAEKALQESESRFSLFMDYLPAIVFLKDHDGRTLFVNKYTQDAFGAYDWIGKTMMEVFPNELGEKLTADDAVSFELGFQKIEESMVQIDGKIHHYETQKFTIDRQGMEPWLGGISLDITDRMRAERKLRESEEKHSSMISNISDVIGIMGIDGKMIYKSPNIEKYFGWKPEDLIGTDGWLTVHNEDMEYIKNEFYELLQKDNSFKTVEYKYMCKDGSYKPIELTATNLVNNSVINGFLLNYHDITVRKKGEAEILRAKNEAEKANRAKSEFLSRMSHELRTPLNSILGFAQLMKMGELSKKQKKGITHILNNGRHLLDLINEVLDISGIEAGRHILNPEPVQLTGIINEITDSMQVAANKRKVSVEFVDSPINSLFVIADRLRLKQVLINLLNNAVKYNNEEGTVTITTALKPAGEQENKLIRISITDTGNGIKPENIGKLFQPFERIGADKTDTEGTGLGLMVVKKLIEAMFGKVGVESKIGAGSTFWIELPLSEDLKNEPFQTIGSPSPELRISDKTTTILYIEDNISNIELVEDILVEHHPKMRLVTSMYGKQTIELALEYKPGLILLDLDLPDMSGIEVLEKLLANPLTKSIPVVIISADAMPFQVEKLKNAGAKDYLTKPLEIIEFLQVIDKWITK